MTKIRFSKKRFLAAISATLGASSFAQSAPGFCEISLGYAPASVVAPTNATAVPGLTMVGIGVFAALIGIAMWRNRKNHSISKFFSVAILAGATGLAAVGSNSFINSVNAAGPYEFNNPAGGTVADTQIPYANPAPTITVQNTSGNTVRITSNGNSSDTGSCTVGANIPNGQSCTTQASSCTPPLQLITLTTAPSFICSSASVATTYPQYNDGTAGLVYAHVPNLDSAPIFDVNGVTVERLGTYPNPTGVAPTYGGSNFLSNHSDLTSGEVEFKFTAPAGYSFSPDTNQSELIQRFPYEPCWSQDSAET